MIHMSSHVQYDWFRILSLTKLNMLLTAANTMLAYDLTHTNGPPSQLHIHQQIGSKSFWMKEPYSPIHESSFTFPR